MTSDPQATESPDDSGPEAAGADSDGTESTAVRAAALQAADTEIDQLVNRRERLAEREELREAGERLKEWESKRSTMVGRIDELSGVIERSESEAADLVTHRQRLEGQLKTVIAPREAEALMHEIATLEEQRDAVETRELEALEEQAALDDRLSEHLTLEATHREATRSADEALATVVGEIDTEIAEITERRDAARGELSESLLARYDRIRASSGVAVANLVGHRCEGCHLDLSAAEVDDVKDEAAANGGLGDCPQCGRMLIV